MSRQFVAAFLLVSLLIVAVAVPVLGDYDRGVETGAYVDLPDEYSDYKENGSRLPVGDLKGVDGFYSMVGPNDSALIVDVTEREPNILIEATIGNETGPVPSRGFEFRDGAIAVHLNESRREPPALVTLRGKTGFLLTKNTQWTVRVRFTETGVELVSVRNGGADG